MTTRLKEAFALAEKLPEPDQEALAEWLLLELASERRWSDLLAASQEVLATLADEAMEEHRAGRTRDLDPHTL
jgi:hypothetical protein